MGRGHLRAARLHGTVSLRSVVSKSPDASGEAQCAQADAVGVVKSVTIAAVLPVSVSNSSNVGTSWQESGWGMAATGLNNGSYPMPRIWIRAPLLPRSTKAAFPEP